MNEFDPTDHTQPPADTDALRAQAADLQAQDAVIGAEDDMTTGTADTTASAHDPTADIPTHAIGSGYDEAPPADADPDSTEPTDAAAPEAPDREVPDTTRVAEDVAPLAVRETVEAPPADEFGDTDVTPREVIDKFDRWDAGETVESSSYPVGQVEASEAEIDSLRDKATTVLGEYSALGPEELARPDSPAIQRRTGLTEEQLTTVRELDERFMAVVTADAERNGYGQPTEDQHTVEIGMYNPDRDGLRWHVDQPGNTTVRYTMTLGDAGTTRFAHGPIQKDQVDRYSGDVLPQADLDTNTGGSHTETAYDHGVVARFFTSYGLHDTPTQGGFRVFFTTSVPIDRAAHEDEQRQQQD